MYQNDGFFSEIMEYDRNVSVVCYPDSAAQLTRCLVLPVRFSHACQGWDSRTCGFIIIMVNHGHCVWVLCHLVDLCMEAASL